jgi:hypothetical protein
MRPGGELPELRSPHHAVPPGIDQVALRGVGGVGGRDVRARHLGSAAVQHHPVPAGGDEQPGGPEPGRVHRADPSSVKSTGMGTGSYGRSSVTTAKWSEGWHPLTGSPAMKDVVTETGPHGYPGRAMM